MLSLVHYTWQQYRQYNYSLAFLELGSFLSVSHRGEGTSRRFLSVSPCTRAGVWGLLGPACIKKTKKKRRVGLHSKPDRLQQCRPYPWVGLNVGSLNLVVKCA